MLSSDFDSGPSLDLILKSENLDHNFRSRSLWLNIFITSSSNASAGLTNVSLRVAVNIHYGNIVWVCPNV